MKKLGMFYEKQGKTEDALETYQSLKDKYPNSPYVADIDKYIIRVSPKG
jgi:TolA-binding protein